MNVEPEKTGCISTCKFHKIGMFSGSCLTSDLQALLGHSAEDMSWEIICDFM